MKAGSFVSVMFDGLEEVRASFDRLPDAVKNRVQKFAMKKAAAPVMAKARANAPVRSGKLRDSIVVRPLKRKRKSRVIGVKVGPSAGLYKGDEYYAAFIEFGYEATERYQDSRGRWHSKKRGTATTPVEAKPFLRPALDQTKDEASRIFRVEIKDAVMRATAKEARTKLKAGGASIVKLNTRRIRTIARRAARGRRA